MSTLKIYKTLPKGWKIDRGITTAKKGYVGITNGKSRFAKLAKDRRKSGQIKIENLPKSMR